MLPTWTCSIYLFGSYYTILYSYPFPCAKPWATAQNLRDAGFKPLHSWWKKTRPYCAFFVVGCGCRTPAIYIFLIYPRCSMYRIFTYIWAFFGGNVGKYSIQGAYGYIYIHILPTRIWVSTSSYDVEANLTFPTAPTSEAPPTNGLWICPGLDDVLSWRCSPKKTQGWCIPNHIYIHNVIQIDRSDRY